MTLRSTRHDRHLPRPRRAIVVLAAATLGIAPALVSPPAAQATGAWGGTDYAGGGTYTWSVPTGVNIVRATLGGGLGGGVTSVYPKQLIGYLRIPTGTTQLEINVGGNGGSPDVNGGSVPGGFGGSGGAGGAGGTGNGPTGAGANLGGGGGGGATDIRPVGAPMSAAYLVSGGVGGAGGLDDQGNNAGGVGGQGALTPQPGQSGAGTDGGTGGAAGTSASGLAGAGANYGSGSNSGGGGGGGGFGGGAGGGAGQAWTFSFRSGSGGGGGGGLSYVDPTNVTWSTESGTLAGTVFLDWLNVTGPTSDSATVGQFDQSEYIAGGGMDGATWELTSGTLPPGMFFRSDSYTGKAYVQGTPTMPGTYSYTLSASATFSGESQLQSSVSTTMTVAAGAASAAATTATQIAATTATLNGDIETGGAAASAIQCTYWPTSSPSTTTTITATPSSIAAGGSKTAVACNATGLTSGAPYEYRVTATIGSAVTSNTRGFTTNSAPATVTTGAATTITRMSATGNGTVSSTQAITAIQCRVATTLAGVAAATPISANPVSTAGAVTNQAVTCPFTGLAANTPYYYGVFATDSAGTATSATFEAFTTREAPPIVTGASASAVTSSSATVTATVSATNSPITAIYCRVAPVGTPVANGTLVPATPSVAAADASNASITCDLTQLSAATSYVARVYATDADGTAANPTVTRFTTSQAQNSGGGGGGSSGGQLTPSVAVSPEAPAATPAPAPIVQAPTWVRLLPGLARVDTIAPSAVTRVRANGPVRLSLVDAPRAVMRRLTPTVVTIGGVGSNRTVIVNVARSGVDTPRWKHLSTTKASPSGSISLPPLAISSGEFTVRITDSSGKVRYALLSMRRR